MLIQPRRRDKLTHSRLWVWLTVAAALLMCGRIASTWHVFSDVMDEPYHIGAGLSMLQVKRHVYGIQHPPLPRVIAAIPLYLAGVRTTDPLLGQVVDDLRAFEVGHEALLRGRLSYWTALTLARGPMLVFPLVALLYVYLLGRYLFNPLAGYVAAIMFSTDPTLLGHGSWVTTDTAACAGYLAATYHGVRLIARVTPRRTMAAGVAIGFALACKFSCVLVLPALGLIWAMRGRRAIRTLPRMSAAAILAMVLAAMVVWTTYGFEAGRIDRLNVLDAGVVSKFPQAIRNTPIPMPGVFVGLAILNQHNQQGHLAYLNGELRGDGWWHYFPQAIAIKSPIALLAGLLIGLLLIPAAGRRRTLRAMILFVPFAVFLVAAMTSRLNIGVRHVLPVIPFLYLFVAMCLTRGRRVVIAAVLIVTALLETAMVHPDYIAFFNALVGGPRNGEKYLLDSNLDWGQDQWRLKQWLKHNAHGRSVILRVFGNPRLREWSIEGFELPAAHSPPRGLLAISKNHRHELYASVVFDDSGEVRVLPSVLPLLRNRHPIAGIGYSIDVYDLDLPR